MGCGIRRAGADGVEIDADQFEAAAKAAKNPKRVAHLVQSELMGRLKAGGVAIEQSPAFDEGGGGVGRSGRERRISGKMLTIFTIFASSGTRISPRSTRKKGGRTLRPPGCAVDRRQPGYGSCLACGNRSCCRFTVHSSWFSVDRCRSSVFSCQFPARAATQCCEL